MSKSTQNSGPIKANTLEDLAEKLRKELNEMPLPKKKDDNNEKNKNIEKENENEGKKIDPPCFILLFAHNGVGKTRLSMEFKNLGKQESERDTLYFNAFTEDLFDWDNDLKGDRERKIKFKADSRFFDGMEKHGIENRIREHLQQYADFDFKIDYLANTISFYLEPPVGENSDQFENIKISRGEENIFIWCFFLAILNLAVDAEPGGAYDWVKYVYIDDPISSLDEHNAITVANGLAEILKKCKFKVIISTHHGLFFNVMFNEFGMKRDNARKKAYILYKLNNYKDYILKKADESPFLQHVAALEELQAAVKTGNISQHHFNTLRSILEKTAIFFGRQEFSSCFEGNSKKSEYTRFLNSKSHAKYSVFESSSLSSEDKEKFSEILNAFLEKYQFNLSEQTATETP